MTAEYRNLRSSKEGMNYLAHIYLSGSDTKMQIGNFIADAVKGNPYKDYPPAIADGIVMHRMIDGFTDSHPAVKDVVKALRPQFGRYAAVLADIYFDYLLASRFDRFSDISLRRFARRFYRILATNNRYLPPRIKGFMWHFICTDRLYKYASKEGIAEVLSIMSEYGRLKVRADAAAKYLAEHEDELRTVFEPFFCELRDVCNEYLRRTSLGNGK